MGLLFRETSPKNAQLYWEMIEMSKNRTTLHNGRKNKQGQAYSPKHNDRKFDLDKAEHIDPERTKENIYWHYLQKENPDMDFSTAEKTFYKDHFEEALKIRNSSYIQHGNKKQVKTLEEYMQEHCPEETIWMIGNAEDMIPAKILHNVWKEQKAWMEATFPQMTVLDWALHVDEQGANHIHERHVFIGHDKKGREVVGQNKALAEMGVSAPNPQKPTGRHNNAKMTYTAKCREHFQEICKRHGLEIEVQPRERSEMGLTQAEYKTRREEAAADRAEIRRRAAERTAAVLQKEIAGDEFDRELANFWGDIEKNDRLQELADIQAENDRLKAENARQQAEISRLKEEQHKTHESLLKLAEARSERAKELKGMNNALRAKKAEFEAITADIEEVKGFLSEAQQNRLQEMEKDWDDYDFSH
jgi:hypothetical protein